MDVLYSIKKFLEPAVRLRRLTIWAVVFSTLRTCYNLATVILIQQIIEHIQKNTISDISHSLFLYILIFVCALIFFYNTYDWRRWKQIYEYDNYIQQRYLQIITTLDNTTFEKVGTWRFIGIIKSASESWSDSLTSLSFNIPALLISLAYSFYLAYQISSSFLLIYLTVIVILWRFVVWINNKGLQYRKNLSNIKVSLSRQLVKLLMSKLEVIMYGKLWYELHSIWALNTELTKNNRKLSFYTFFTHEGPRSLLNIVKVIIVALLLYSTLLSTIELPQLIWFIIVLGYVDNTLQDFATSYKQITKKFNDIEKLREFEDLPTMWESYGSWKAFVFDTSRIEIVNVNFSYSWWKEIFNEFWLSMEWGKKIAIVWWSGTGKTTLLKLIWWYIKPDKGSIIVDGQDLQDVSLQSYYRHIWYLTQDPSVFDGTIKDNLMYAVSEQSISDEKLRNIISLAQCDWIYDLRDWFDTEIGEKWIRLSWWQKQRLAIAKIMLKDPSIILLDEPTSALDSFAEEEVTKAMNNLFQWRTVIIIAHRLQTVKHADEIIVLWSEKEKVGTQILERGNHEELVAKWWFYAKMLELQSGF